MAVALIVAAGRGERLGVSGPKAFVRIAGRPMVSWSVDAFAAVPEIRQTVVAVPPGWEPADADERDALAGCAVCAGGAERSLSVRAALEACPAGEGGEAVLVHDAARPMLRPDLISALVSAVEGPDAAEAAIAATMVTDTIKLVDEGGIVLATPERSTLRAVQTPQAFARRVLGRALAQDDDVLAAATDDAGLVEALGVSVHVLEAPTENFKVTNPHDLKLADLILAARSGSGAAA